MQTIVRIQNCELSFSDEDVVNSSEIIPQGESNPHSVRPWLFHDHGFALAVVFADCLHDALDIAADANKLDRYAIDKADYEDYGVETDSPSCSFLGNAGEPFDIDALGYVELKTPPFSFVALWQAQFPTGENGAISAHFA